MNEETLTCCLLNYTLKKVTSLFYVITISALHIYVYVFTQQAKFIRFLLLCMTFMPVLYHGRYLRALCSCLFKLGWVNVSSYSCERFLFERFVTARGKKVYVNPTQIRARIAAAACYTVTNTLCFQSVHEHGLQCHPKHFVELMKR